MFASLPVTALRAFEAAARLRSFKAAAAELSVTPTAVSHQIKALERHAGVALFDRVPQGVRLTDAAPGCSPARTAPCSTSPRRWTRCGRPARPGP